MKRLTKVLILLLALIYIFSLTACGKNPVTITEDSVFITAKSSEYDIEGKTLSEFMEVLSDDNKLTFEIGNGMVTSINGKANANNSYWMLYTDDVENSNSAWGTVEHEGKTYSSAALGATELVVKDGATYVWVYQSF